MGSNYINLYYQNVRGIRSKTVAFRLGILSENYDIVAITETWLNDSVLNAELFPPGYQVFRRDRSTGQSRGGGVLLAVSNLIQARRLQHLESDGENLWVKLELSNKKSFIISVVYFPPNSPMHVYDSFFEKLDSIVLKHESIIILGDFNLQVTGIDYDLALGSEVCKSLLYFNTMYKLSLKNNVFNELGKTLDLVLSDMDNLTVSGDCCPIVPIDKYHPPLVLTWEMGQCKKIIYENRYHSYNFKKADFLLMYNSLRDRDWKELESIFDVNEAVQYFYSELYQIFNYSVPLTQVRKSKYPQWFDCSLIFMIKRKERLRRKYNKFKFDRDLIELKELRRKIKIDVKTAFDNFVSSVESRVNCNPASFWSVIKSFRTANQSPDVMTVDGEEVEGGAAIAERFASYFGSVYEPCQLDNDELCRRATSSPTLCNVPCLAVPSITADEVLLALKKLKPKTSVGPDGIPPYILKACAELLVTPLLHIFNLSLKTCLFPKVWKQAKVVPIFKKGDKSDVKNYRPVSILSAPVKVFEAIIHHKVFEHTKNFISPYQHGFFPGRSINSNLLNFSEYCSSVLDQSGQVDVLYTDFEKAFDKVNHLSLLCQLNYFGISDALIKFFCSYLRGRKQFVFFKGYSSSEFFAESGVPQGSNLGPLLFVLFIDSIKNCVSNCRLLLYADDLKLFRTIKNHSDCMAMQEDIVRLFDWSKTNLKFHVGKCAVVSFTRKSEQNKISFDYVMGSELLSRKLMFKDLGVSFDSRFCFNEHVVLMCKSAFSVLGFIRRSANFLKNINTLKLLYCSLVRSKLEYAAVIWCPHVKYLEVLVENVQKRFLRFLYFKSFGHYTTQVPYSELLRIFQLDSLGKRRKMAMLVYLHRLVSGACDDMTLLSMLDFNVPRHNSRSRQLLQPRFSRSNIGANSPLNSMVRLFNLISNNNSVDIFKSFHSFRNSLVHLNF